MPTLMKDSPQTHLRPYSPFRGSRKKSGSGIVISSADRRCFVLVDRTTGAGGGGGGGRVMV